MSLRKPIISLILIAALSTSAPALVMAEQPYILGAGDVIEVLVHRSDDVSRVVTIRPDGMIALPLIGEVRAAGLTPDALSLQLTALFAKYFRDPKVSIIVREFRRLQVAVLGQVARPGVYELPRGAKVLHALAAAGGLAADAGVGEVRLIRAQDPPVIINLELLLVRGEMDLNLQLETGDTLVVPEDPTARVYVFGEVARPGVFPLRGPLTTLQAMTLAGGPTTRARLNQVQILRRNGQPAQLASTVTQSSVPVATQPNNPIGVIPVDLQAVIDGDISRDLPLQRGDVLFVPGSTFTLDNIALLLGVVTNTFWLIRR